MKTKKFTGDRIFDFVNVTVILLITIIILVPLLNVLASSFSGSTALAEGGFIFFPKEWSLDNYRAVFKDTSIWKAFFISVAKTVIGVVTHVFFCAMVAFALSKKDLRGRKLYTVMGIITMFFSGGMIPTYLLMKQLGLLNNFMVYILPQLFSYYDVVILMNFFGRYRLRWKNQHRSMVREFGKYFCRLQCRFQNRHWRPLHYLTVCISGMTL